MIIRNLVRSGFYLDSVALMRASSELEQRPGITDAVMMIGTDPNKQILRDAGLLATEGEAAGPGDLIIAVGASDEPAALECIAAAEAALGASRESAPAGAQAAPRSLDGALGTAPDANLALISTAGVFAVREARGALNRGLNVMLFSDNVELADEVALKHLASERGLLLMGPDCGTAYIAGTPLAFANVVRAGNVGVVAASGTGLQELAVQLDRLGCGLSHAIGVGGRDLSDAVGGLSTLTALDWLEGDDSTEQVVIVSKPPGAQTAARVFERLRDYAKPVTICMLGQQDAPDALRVTGTIEAAAHRVAGAVLPDDRGAGPQAEATAGYIAGLFCGGTLCAEAQIVLSGKGASMVSNAPAAGARTVGDSPLAALGCHLLLDLGADEYTQGRPHPMIEPAVRTDALAAVLKADGVAVVLLDVVLGYGSHPNPSGAIADALNAHAGERPEVVAYVCGTSADPQGLELQRQILLEAGVRLAPSNAAAARLALSLCR